jgi:hypothetical protein
MGSSCRGSAREAKWRLTAKGRRPREPFIFLINSLSSALKEAFRVSGRSSIDEIIEVIRELMSFN